MTSSFRRRGLFVLIASAFFVLSPSAGQVRAEDTPKSKPSGLVVGGDVVLNETRSRVLALAGGIVITDGSLGDAAMAAGTVHMTGGEIGRLAVSAGTVTIDGGRLGDILAAAGTLKINAPVSGDLRAAGGSIVTTRDAVIGGDARLSGGDVILDGTFKNSVSVRADHIELAGTIGGTVYAFGDDVRIAPGTRIGGDLIYSANTVLALPEDVVVGGQVLRRGHTAPEYAEDDFGLLRHAGHAVLSLGFAGLLLCGLIVAAIRPSLVSRAGDAFVHRFGASLLTGLVVACAIPVAVIVLAFTVIGIPLALLLLAAAATLAGFGLVVACRWAGDRIRTRFGRPLPQGTLQTFGWGLAGFVLFAVIGVIPTLGGIAQAVAILAGSGAALGALWNRWPGHPTPQDMVTASNT